MHPKFLRRLVTGAMLFPASAAAATYTLTLDEAVRLAEQRSPEARRIELEEHRSRFAHRGARRELWPDLALELAAPEYTQHFDVAPLPSAPGDTAVTGEPNRVVYAKTTTTMRNASGAMQYRQLLPWRGTFSADGNVMYHDEETSPEGTRASRNDYQVSASVGIDVPILGQDPGRRQLRHADLEWHQASERARRARAQLDFDTVSRYLDLLRAHLALEVAQSETEEAVGAQDLARRKVTSGLLAEVDRMRTDVFRAEHEVRLTEAGAELARAGDELKLHLGLDLADSLVLTEELRPFTLDAPVEVWVARALENRADIGLLEEEVAVLERDRREHRAYWPQVDVSMRYGGGASDPELADALQALSANDLSLRLGVRVPLWDSGRLALEDAGESTQIALQQLEADQTRVRIELEVRDAVRRIQEADRRHAVLAASSQLAEEVRRITSERYQRGLVDTRTFLEAQSEAAAARLGTTASLLDLYHARARLRFVTMTVEE